MTKKRFVLQDLDILCRVLDNGKPINGIETVHLLNKFYEENEQLKSICQDHRNHANDFKADCVRLEKENEQLKQQCKDFIEMLDDMSVAYLINDGLEEILND